jgi:hypothetical protein
MQKTHRQPLVVKNLFSQKAFLSKCYTNNNKRKKDNTYSIKNLINKKAIINYNYVTKNLENIKKIEKTLKNKPYKVVKHVRQDENDLHVLSNRKDSKHKSSFHRPSLSACFDSGYSTANLKRRSSKKIRKNSKERKNSISKKHQSQSKQNLMASFSKMNHKNEQMKNIMDLLKNKNEGMQIGKFYNDSILKAIQTKIMSSKIGKLTPKEDITPRSINKNIGGSTQRTNGFKSTAPISAFNTTTISPGSITLSKKGRDNMYSPISMKAITHRNKKSPIKGKNSTSKKRDSLGRNRSRHNDDITMFTTKNKP